ncbi:hypothetical protein BTW01_03855 [Bacillus sp. SKDU12]|nr:hypothetical protein BTW01_03855 [Bacillus sp. SKDU12]
MYLMYYPVPSPYIHNNYTQNIQRSEQRKYQPSIGQMISAPANTSSFPRETRIFIHDVRFEYVSSIGDWMEFIYVVYPIERGSGVCAIEGRWIPLNELDGKQHISR